MVNSSLHRISISMNKHSNTDLEKRDGTFQHITYITVVSNYFVISCWSQDAKARKKTWSPQEVEERKRKTKKSDCIDRTQSNTDFPHPHPLISPFASLSFYIQSLSCSECVLVICNTFLQFLSSMLLCILSALSPEKELLIDWSRWMVSLIVVSACTQRKSVTCGLFIVWFA